MAWFHHFNGDLYGLEEHLVKALKLTKNKKQRRKIMYLLIPTRMNLYSFPKKELLWKLNFEEFEDISDAIITGDILKFE